MRQARLTSDEQDSAPVGGRRQMTETTNRTRGEFIFGLVFFVSVVIGVWSTAADIRRWLFDEDKIPVSGLVVQGELEYVKTDEIRQVLAVNPQTNNFFKLDVNQLQKATSLKNRNEMWLFDGRTLGEKSFMIFEKGNVTAYGFYELHTQINTWKKIAAIKIDLDTKTTDLENDFKLALLREDFEIIPTPEK